MAEDGLAIISWNKHSLHGALLCTIYPIFPDKDKEITDDEISLIVMFILFLPTQLIEISTTYY